MSAQKRLNRIVMHHQYVDVTGVEHAQSTVETLIHDDVPDLIAAVQGVINLCDHTDERFEEIKAYPALIHVRDLRAVIEKTLGDE